MAPITPSTGRSERGAALVEFALTVPLLLVVIAGIVDFGFLFQRYEVVTNAAREGARLASLPNYTKPVVRARVRAYVQEGLNLPNSAMPTVIPDTDAGVNMTTGNLPIALSGGGTANVSVVTVDVHYFHTFLLLQPVMRLINKNWGTSITLNAVSTMRVEVPASGS
jgi:Flp pilus assembly protein TadG